MSSDEPAPDSSSRNKSLAASPEGRGSRVARGLAPALVMVVCAWVSTAVISHAGHSAPSGENWREAAEYLKSQRGGAKAESSELIVFAPEWADPIGRQHFGDQMDIAMAARMVMLSLNFLASISL